jgi:hypothetical protein
MSTGAEGPRTERVRNSGFSHTSAWELQELAPVLIIVFVGLLVFGSAISTWMYFADQMGVPGYVGWSLVSSALRWISPSTSTMLLLSAALIWWQYGYWNSEHVSDLSDEMVSVHVARLRTISKWNLAAFSVTIASAFLLILSSILQNSYSGANLSIWANSVDTLCEAVGTILLSLLGIVALRRVLAASRVVIGGDGDSV